MLTEYYAELPEAKAVKHRVHLDVYAADLAGPEGAGRDDRGASARHAHLDCYGRP